MVAELLRSTLCASIPNMQTIIVNQFDGGMVSDPRDPRGNVARIIQHFDIYTNKHKLTPYPSAENGDSGSASNLIQNFAYDGTTLFGAGTGIFGASSVGIFTRTNFSDATWTALINNAGSARNDADVPLFVYYKKTAKLYGVRGNQYVWTVTPSGPSANNAEYDLTAYTTVSNGIVHSKDDILYFGYDNKIAKNDNGSWTAPALTLPSNYTITSICEFGNYLAIGCKDKSGLKSRVFLWDRNTSLPTLDESIDWQEGSLAVLEELEGNLIGVSFEGTTGAYNFNARMTCRYYSGSGGAVKFAETLGHNISPTVQGPLFKAKGHNRILFPASAPIGTTAYYGIWSIGRNSQGVPFSLTLNRLLSQTVTTLSLYGLIELGDYLFVGYESSSAGLMDKTDNTQVYTQTSVYESTINPNMPPKDRITQKKLIYVGATYEALPSGGQVVVKYRVEGGSWNTIFTETTVGQVRTDPMPRASAAQFTDGIEYEFRIESTGGAEVTSLFYQYQIITTDL